LTSSVAHEILSSGAPAVDLYRAGDLFAVARELDRRR